MIKETEYLLSRIDNIIEYANSIKEVLERDKEISTVYLSEKLERIEDNLKIIEELEKEDQKATAIA